MCQSSDRTVFVGQEFESSVPGWFWLIVSRESAVKILATAKVTWKLGWARGSLPTWLTVTAVGLSTGRLCVLPTRQVASPKAAVLSRGPFWPPGHIWQYLKHLQLSQLVRRKHYWHMAGSVPGCCGTSYNGQDGPQVEKLLWSKWSLTKTKTGSTWTILSSHIRHLCHILCIRTVSPPVQCPLKGGESSTTTKAITLASWCFHHNTDGP